MTDYERGTTYALHSNVWGYPNGHPSLVKHCPVQPGWHHREIAASLSTCSPYKPAILHLAGEPAAAACHELCKSTIPLTAMQARCSQNSRIHG